MSSHVDCLKGINLINFVKSLGTKINNSDFPSIFNKLDSLNDSLEIKRIVLKLGSRYYYLIENISKESIVNFNSVVMDSQDSNVLEFKAIAISIPNNNLFTYTNQHGYSQFMTESYYNANTIAQSHNQKIFQPFSNEYYHSDFNVFTDNYMDLTNSVNTPTTNVVKSYTLCFYAKHLI